MAVSEKYEVKCFPREDEISMG